jgi:hypothetical protein
MLPRAGTGRPLILRYREPGPTDCWLSNLPPGTSRLHDLQALLAIWSGACHTCHIPSETGTHLNLTKTY